MLLILGFVVTVLLACDEKESQEPTERAVTFDISATSLGIGDEVVVTPVFEPNVAPERTYNWRNSNPDAVGLVMNEDFSATLMGKRKGNATLTFSSDDDAVAASVDIVVNGAEDDGILKVLAIGNSFSEDAVEQYLYDLGKAAGVKMVIGNMYIGGATLEMHYNNATDDAAAYDYRKIGEDGVKTSTPGTAIATALTDENWDYVSLQQQSGLSGIYDAYVAHLPALVAYVADLTMPETQLIFHQTWAYSTTSNHSDFPRYGNNQEQMYAAITQAVRKASILTGLDYVVPAGTAIQNGRNTLLGQSFTRDGYHLSFGVGRYTAACTWFEALTGMNVVGNAFSPDGLNSTEVEIAQHSAHAAVADPDRVTQLTDYQNNTPVPLTASVFVNFGHRIVAGWNTVGDHHEGAGITNLKDENGDFSGIALTVTKRFNALNETGESVVTTDFPIPSDVSTQSYFGNPKGVFQNLLITESQIKLSGLDKNAPVNLCFFSSRAGVTDNRETKFIVVGDNAATVLLNASKNTTQVACASNITPDANGEITVTITAGENNNNSFGFYYLNAMRVSPGG